MLNNSQGNSNADVLTTSPANAMEAITVGATDITDTRAFYSNYGLLVDVFAPGSNVTSAWTGGGYRTISGTSMATPNVAGLVAYFLPIIGTSTSPAAMSNYIKQVSTKGALRNIRELTFLPAAPFIFGLVLMILIALLTPNNLVFNNFVP